MVEREVGRRRKARTIGIATVMAILVVATALSGRIMHHGATHVADPGVVDSDHDRAPRGSIARGRPNCGGPLAPWHRRVHLAGRRAGLVRR